MNTMQKMKNITGILITAGLSILLLTYSTNLLGEKAADEKYKPFFEQTENFDVLFMGTSHVIYGISPMDLWHDYGIVSYNFGTPAQIIPCSYWLMQNALNYTHPKLIVIDCYTLSDPRKIVVSAHSSFDAFPLSRTKLDSIFDLFKDEKTDLTRMEFLWNYSSFHFRWNDLHDYDFDRKYTNMKGGGFLFEIESGHEVVKIPHDNKMEEDTAGVVYLKKMIEDCQDRGIDVLLTYLPFPADAGSQQEANRVYDIASQYNVNYLNFLDMDIVNYATDCADDNHLNTFGIRKVTDYIGNYITEHYCISDQRSNDLYQDWLTDYKYYRNELNTNLKTFESLDYTLLALYDKNYFTLIEIHDPEILNNDYYIRLFENMGINSNALTANTDLLVIQEAGTDADSFDNFHKSDGPVPTVLGELRFTASDSGDSGLYLDNKEIYKVTSNPYFDADVQITVFDKNTEEIVEQCGFSKTKTSALRSYKK